MDYKGIGGSFQNNRTMKSIDSLIIATVLLAIAGCATTPDVHSRGDNSAQVSSSETFALLPVTVNPEVPPAGASSLVQAAETGARDTLRALGYSETSRENADLVFYMHGKSLEPETITDWNYLREPSKFGMRADEVEAYSGRRIYVETYDNHSKHQVWMGWIECSCRGVDPERVQHEIQRIVATFPPRSQGMNLSAR
jgi:hypothetical protein